MTNCLRHHSAKHSLNSDHVRSGGSQSGAADTARQAVHHTQYRPSIHAMSCLQHDPGARAYEQRLREEGKTLREIKCCLKRYLARRLFRLMEAEAKMT